MTSASGSGCASLLFSTFSSFLIIVGSTALGVSGTLVIEHLIAFPGTLTLIIGIFSALIGWFIAGAWNYWRSGGFFLEARKAIA